jgi:rhomboid protease GluP
MAFGFSPKYIREIPINEYSKERFLTLAIEAVKILGWEVGYVSETGFVAYTPFSWKSYSEEFKLTIAEDIATLKSMCTGGQMADWGKNKKNIEEFLGAFDEAKELLTEEQLAERDELLRTALAAKSEEVENILDKPPLTAGQKVLDTFSIFKPTGGYFVTPVIIIVNIVIYILMVANGVNFFLPENQDMLKWGADFAPNTLNGEWWRIITCCFIHFGILHLLLNMYALIYIGSLLEPHLGKAKFLLAYMLTGICSSIISLWWHEELVISAGASGAIFGMYGVFLAMLTTNLIEKAQRKALLTSIGIFVLYNLVNGVHGNIDNAAHIGGLLTGMVIGYAFVPGLKNPQNPGLKYGLTTIVSIVLVAGAAFIFSNIHN